MVSRAPADRYETCEEARAALEATLDHLHASEANTPRPRTAARTGKQDNRQLIAVVAVSVLVLAATGYWAFSGPSNPPAEIPAPTVASSGERTAGETTDSPRTSDTAREPSTSGAPSTGRSSAAPIDLGDDDAGASAALRERIERRSQFEQGNSGESEGPKGESEQATDIALTTDLPGIKELSTITRDWRAGVLDHATALKRIERFRRRYDGKEYGAPVDKVLQEIGQQMAKEERVQVEAQLKSVIEPLVSSGDYAGAERRLAELKETFTNSGEFLEAKAKEVRSAADEAWRSTQAASEILVQSGDFATAQSVVGMLEKTLPAPLKAELDAYTETIKEVEKAFTERGKALFEIEARVQDALAAGRLSDARDAVGDVSSAGAGTDAVGKILAGRTARLKEEIDRCERAQRRLERGIDQLISDGTSVPLEHLGTTLRAKLVKRDGVDLVYKANKSDRRIPLFSLSALTLEGLALAGARGDDEQLVSEDTGVLVLYAAGPNAARPILSESPKLSAVLRNEYTKRLNAEEARYLERRVAGLVSEASRLADAESSDETRSAWQSLTAAVESTIRQHRTRPIYRKHRATLAETYLQAGGALLAGESVDGLFRGTVRTVRDVTEITYNFRDAEELKDFRPVGSETRVRHVARKGAELRGEVRLLSGAPFRSTLSVTVNVPSRGYSTTAPNINVALWTHDNDRVTLSETRRARSARDDDEDPSDYIVFGVGYYVANRGFLRVRGQSGGVVQLPANVLFGGARGTPIDYVSGSQCVWAEGVKGMVRGSQTLAIDMDAKGIKWKVNGRSQPIKKARDIRRFDREEPYSGSVTLFTNGRTVLYSGIKIRGEIDPAWVASQLQGRVVESLKQFEPDYPFGGGTVIETSDKDDGTTDDDDGDDGATDFDDDDDGDGDNDDW